ncbi:hypothetical protein BUALT_Bualt03G0173200 [Buddleja alternifolia]|uniref:Uncharacterized protein n=1 Tax=Buddleja alternifolia TaxID=168488 RepID=A0AAV6Y5X7_9LAMI|nr:hypothetical protein BUALT_Bualt03G0173200 [Buddleja alternifolia]
MGGCDMIIGGDWFSPIEFDFDKMRITTSQNGKKLTMKAITEQSGLRLISSKATISITTKPILETETDNNITESLGEFEEVFSQPKELFLDRNIQHKITVKPSMIPKKYAPYRYL